MFGIRLLCPVAARNIMFTSDDICVIIDYGMMKEMRKSKQGDERYYRQSNDVSKPVRWYDMHSECVIIN